MPPFSVSDCRQDPDLEGLRKAKPNEVHDLLTPRCELKWTNCLLLADLTLTNRSVFPLSKVRVACRFGGRDFHQACDLIKPGDSYKWSNVSANIGDRFSEFKLINFTVTSEQGTFSG
jgi:hypothetical protein